MPARDKTAGAATASLLSHAEELIDAGRIHEARRIMTQFLERRHLDPCLLPALASLYLRMGKPELALRTMYRAIEESPAEAELHNTLGLIYASIGREEEGRRHFERALEIEPTNAEALRNLAFIVHRSGERDQAYDLLVRCYRATPLSVELRLICGTLLELDGRLDEAANCYRDAMELGGVSEQVELASQRMFALGERPTIGFEQIIEGLEAAAKEHAPQPPSPPR